VYCENHTKHINALCGLMQSSCAGVVHEVPSVSAGTFLGFGCGEAEVSVLLRHDAASVGNRFLTFRDHYVFLT